MGTITTWSCAAPGNGFTLTKQYILGPSGEQMTEVDYSGGSATWAHTNAYAGDVVATYLNDGQGPHYRLADWLGTTRVQVNSAGVAELTCASLPFGDPQVPCTSPSATEQFFTGQERDQETGNDYFQARHYASSTGRFMSPDDGSDQFISEPQSWNLYSYARNNPVTNTDPSGRSVQICTDNGYGGTQCNTVDNPTYGEAAGGDNGGLNVPSEQEVERNGGGFITDSDGNVVGVLTYIVDGAFDGPANLAGANMIGNGGMSAIKYFVAGSLVGGTLGGGALALSGSGVAATISLNVVNFGRVAGATLAGGWKVGQQMARTGATSPAGVLDFAKETMTAAIEQGTVVQAQFGTIYRVGSTFVVQNSQNVISSVVVNAEAGKGIVLEYFSRGGK
jgi:RHS repeat-associated protein